MLLTKEQLQKALVQGGVTYGLTRYQFSPLAAVRLGGDGGRTIPLHYATAGLGFLSSIASDLVHDMVDPAADPRKKVNDYSAQAIGALVSGGTFYAAMSLLHPNLINEFGRINTLAFGVSSELASVLALNTLHELKLIN